MKSNTHNYIIILPKNLILRDNATIHVQLQEVMAKHSLFQLL